MLDEVMRANVSATQHAVSVTSTFKPFFDEQWVDEQFRIGTCPPKQIVARLNERLQAAGYKALSMTALARAHRVSEVPQEVVDVLSLIESRTLQTAANN
jgi:hypothetical protein